MGWFSDDIETMEHLFVHSLQDIYYAEKQIHKSLPKMIEKATDPTLKQGLEAHRTETAGHIARLEQVFKQHGAEVKAVDCPAIDGILKEADEVVILPLYSAGEKAIPGVDSRLISDHLSSGHCRLLGELDPKEALRNAKSLDTVVFMGAGDISESIRGFFSTLSVT